LTLSHQPTRAHGSEDNVATDEQSDSEESEGPLLSKADKRSERYLKRMMPAGMATRYLQESKEPHHLSESDDEDLDPPRRRQINDGPLMPGQSRTRVRSSSQARKFDFKGDKESDNEYPPGPSSPHLLSPVQMSMDVFVSERFTLEAARTISPIDLTGDDGSASSSESNISSDSDSDDSEAIEDNRYGGTRTLDGYLNRTRSLGSYKRPRHRINSHRQTGALKKGLHIVTGEARRVGHGRQTLLPFKKAEPRYHSRIASKRLQHSSHHIVTDMLETDFPPNDEVCDNNTIVVDRKKARKSCDARSGGHNAPNGIYIFMAEPGTHLEGGTSHAQSAPSRLRVRDQKSRKRRQRRCLIDTKFRKSSIPSRIQPAAINVDKVEFTAQSTDIFPGLDDDALPERLSHIREETVVPHLSSGISFPATSYLKKGWLFELVTSLGSQTQFCEPPTFRAMGMTFGPHLTATAMQDLLVIIFDRLSDIVIGLPSLESVIEWNGVMRVCCQTVSWLGGVLPEHSEERSGLQTTIESHCQKLLNQMKAAELTAATVDIFALNTCWFVVELLLRLGHRLQSSLPTVHSDVVLVFAISLLTHYLLEYGTHRSLLPILHHEHAPIDASNVDEETALSLRSAELWICLFYVLTLPHSTDSLSGSIIWTYVQRHLQRDSPELADASSLSTLYWCTIFDLMRLSQFSIHGMTTSSSQVLLPSYWPLVKQAMDLARGRWEGKNLDELTANQLLELDKGTCVLIFHCVHLHADWNWKLIAKDGDISDCLKQILELFRRRNFDKLSNEHPERANDYPPFMSSGDEQYLLNNEVGNRDSPWVLFMKLVAKYINQLQEVETSQQLGTTRRLLKSQRFLSAVIPMSNIQIPKDRPVGAGEVSMLINRLVASFVAISLDSRPERSQESVQRARGYLDFAGSDITLRVPFIRGWMYCASLMVKKQYDMQPIFDWLHDMYNCLSKEYRTMSTSEDGGKRKITQPLSLVLKTMRILLLAVQTVLSVAREQKKYPNPCFLG
jgi:hypothetical protein